MKKKDELLQRAENKFFRLSKKWLAKNKGISEKDPHSDILARVMMNNMSKFEFKADEGDYVPEKFLSLYDDDIDQLIEDTFNDMFEDDKGENDENSSTER